MLERAKIRSLVKEIITREWPDDFPADIVFNQSDVPFDAQDKPFAVNIKTLRQDARNTAEASLDSYLESNLRLQILVYMAGNVENWSEALDELCEKIQWALIYDRDFRKYHIESLNTIIDDGTGEKNVVREGGAMIVFNLKYTETPEPEFKYLEDEQSDKKQFRRQATEIKVSETQRVDLMVTPENDNPENPEPQEPSEEGAGNV